MRITKDPQTRKKEIMDCARSLFLKDGYNNTSIDSIVKKLGVAKGLFYYYFKSKDALMEELEDEFMDSFEVGLKKIIKNNYDNPREMLLVFIDYFLEIIKDNKDFLSLSQGYGNKKRKSLEQKLKDAAMESALDLFKNKANLDFVKKLHYPELTINILISGFADLYLSGIEDKSVFLTIAGEILNLEEE